MKKLISYLSILLMAFLFGVAAKGKLQPVPKDSASETVIIPYDSSKPLEAQKLDQLYIPYEQFIELWEAAKTTRRGVPPEKLDASYALSSARYDAKLEGDLLRVTGQIDFQTFGDDWVSVPLSFKETKVGGLKLDGQPAPLESDRVVVEKAGPHRIEVEFEIPLKGDKSRIQWGIPKTAGTLLSLTLPATQMKASVQGGRGVERINGDQKIVTAALGTTDRVELLLDASVGLGTMTQPALAKINARLEITPSVEAAHAEFAFSFPESQQDHFTVSLDKSMALVQLDAPNLKSWKMTTENERQTLEIVLAEPARDAFVFSIDAERPASGRQRSFPFFSAGANRIELSDGLFSMQEVEVTPHPSGAFRQIQSSENGGAGMRLVAAFSTTDDKESLLYEAGSPKLTNKAEISYVYQVNHSKIELIASLKLHAKSRALYNIALTLPPGFVVQAVESDRLKDWWHDGDTLAVRFKGGTPEITALVVHLVEQFKSVPEALEINPLALPDSWAVEGDGIIAAARSVKAAMTVAGATEIDPQNAATDFRILPPMERKRGFSFKKQDFHALVTLETMPARITGDWVMSAQAHENWVSVSTHVNLTVHQGSADGISFRLPASAPEARVAGENVRETTSRVEEGWRVYQVAFQTGLMEQTDFTVNFDLPGEGKIPLPAFELLNLERAEGFIIVDNASEYQMQVQPVNLDAAQSSQIPFLPQISHNAHLFRAMPGWALQIDLVKLEKEAGRDAFVAWAELTTAIREDGSEWHRASYHLQNRSLQFLPVKLPVGAELASVSVAGENVQADRGTVAGQDVLLVPLIKTKPGDVSYDVELVYRKVKSRSFFGLSHKRLADPEVVGITVERTLWNLYLPEENASTHFGGNMQEVLAEVNKTEKLEGMLNELQQLNSLASLGGDSEVSRNAGENFRKLAKSLEEDSESVDGRVVADEAAKGDKPLFAKQGAEVIAKKREIQAELGRQKQTFEGNSAQVNSGMVSQPLKPLAEPLVTTNPGQRWTSNAGYVAVENADESKKEMLDQKEAAGSKLYVNDYVMNVQGGKNGEQKITDSANAHSVTLSDVRLSLGAFTSTGAADLTKGNAPSPVQSQMAQIQDTQAAHQSIALQAGQQSADASFAAPAPVRVAMPSTPQSAPGGNENVKFLGSARSNLNKDQRQDTLETDRDGALARAEAAVDSGHLKSSYQSAIGQSATKASEAEFASVSSMGGGGERSTMLGYRSSPHRELLHPEGAISLPIDFPTEGRVYHFQKLKSNARLSLWITPPPWIERAQWLLIFVIAAALIQVVFKMADRRTIAATVRP